MLRNICLDVFVHFNCSKNQTLQVSVEADF